MASPTSVAHRTPDTIIKGVNCCTLPIITSARAIHSSFVLYGPQLSVTTAQPCTAFMWQISNIALNIAFFSSKMRVDRFPVATISRVCMCFAVKSGRCAKSEYDLRTYYGDMYYISQEKNNLGLTIPVYNSTIGVPPPGYIHTQG